MGVPVAVSGWQDMDVEGKVVIITGSAQGLGKAFAARLLNAGAKVCLSDLNEDVGVKTRNEFEERFGKENVHFIKYVKFKYSNTIRHAYNVRIVCYSSQ